MISFSFGNMKEKLKEIIDVLTLPSRIDVVTGISVVVGKMSHF